MTKMADLIPIMNEAFENDKTFSFPINGTSMQPFLKTGDVVTVAKPINLKKYDIILYLRDNGQYVLHRIVKIKNGAFVLLGDHQVCKEYPIYPNQVLAKVISYQKGNKEKELKGFKYNLYLLRSKSMLFRRVRNKLGA